MVNDPINVLIPADSVVRYAYSIMHPMINKDYDIYDMVSQILTALNVQSAYPQSVNRLLYDTSKMSQNSKHDFELYNKAITHMYHKIALALNSIGLYDEQGRLTHPYFHMVNYDIIVASAAIEEPAEY